MSSRPSRGGFSSRGSSSRGRGGFNRGGHTHSSKPLRRRTLERKRERELKKQQKHVKAPVVGMKSKEHEQQQNGKLNGVKDKVKKQDVDGTKSKKGPKTGKTDEKPAFFDLLTQDEMDPTNADELELQYLEKMLGLDSEKSRATSKSRLKKEFEEDGLGDLFEWMEEWDAKGYTKGKIEDDVMGKRKREEIPDEDVVDVKPKTKQKRGEVQEDEDVVDIKPKKKQKREKVQEEEEEDEEEMASYEIDSQDDDIDEEEQDEDEMGEEQNDDVDAEQEDEETDGLQPDDDDEKNDDDDDVDDVDEMDRDEDEEEDEMTEQKEKPHKKSRKHEEEADENDNEEDEHEQEEEKEEKESMKKSKKPTYDDIYGWNAPTPASLAAFRADPNAKLEPTTSISTSTSTTSTSKYIPPHLRTSLSASDERTRRMQRSIRGLLNRLTEQNIDPILTEIRSLYDIYSRREIHETLCTCMITMCSDEMAVLNALIIASAGLIAALQITCGMEVGALFLEKLVLSYHQYHIQQSSKPASNILLLIIHLYNMERIAAGIVYDIIRELCKEMNSLDVELLLLVIQSCGAQLRRDDPRALKEIILLISSKANAITSTSTSSTSTSTSTSKPTPASASSSSSTASASTSTSRVQHMLDMIYDLKNNKRRHQQAAEVLTPIKSWLSVLEKRSKQVGEQQLRISYQDIMNSSKTGRWWLVGSAYRGKRKDDDDTHDDTSASTSASTSTSHTTINPDAIPIPDLMSLAQQQRMNTDMRKAVFCVVMGAADYMDAFEKICKLNLTSTQSREVVRVLMDCVAQEKSYNPYYGLVLTKLCEEIRDYRFTLQLAYWDRFKIIEEEKGKDGQRRVVNLARLLCDLLTAEYGLSLQVWKPISWESLGPRLTLFIYTTMYHMLATRSEQEIYRICAAKAGKESLSSVRDGLILFFHRYLILATNTNTNDDTKHATALRLKANIKVAKHALLNG